MSNSNYAHGLLNLYIITLLYYGQIVCNPSLTCSPTEEGLPAILTCDLEDMTGPYPLNWIINNEQYAVCTYMNSCSCKNFASGSVNISCLRTKVTSSIILTKLTALTLNQATCATTTSFADSCTINFYSLSRNITCDTPDVQGNIVLATCRAAKAFPKPICVFYKESEVLSNISYNYNSDNKSDVTVFTDFSCTLMYNINKTGEHTFKWEMYLEINKQKYSARSGNTPIINLSLPVVNLTDTCYKSLNVSYPFMKIGTTSPCTCKIVAPGFPSGLNPFWVDEKNQQHPGYLQKNETSMTITIEPNKSYTCIAVSALGKNSTSLNLIAAYGPTKVSLQTVNNIDDGIDLCPGKNVTINFKCTVSESDVYPNSSIYTGVQSSEIAGNLIQFRPTTSGNHTLSCIAINTIFPDLRASATKRIYVRVPPEETPVLSITGAKTVAEDTFTVIENSPINITCNVAGGVPSVNNITLSCDFLTNTTDGPFIIIHYAFTRQSNNKTCTCSASHITGCYNKSSETTLKVLYPPVIKDFTTNSNTTQLTVNENSSITFNCNADSNPESKFIFYHMRKQVNVNDNKTTKMYCNSTGEYTCVAFNDVGFFQSTSNVTVYVQCPQYLEKSDDDNKMFYAKAGNNAVITVDVFGYPSPISYSLNKDNHEIVNTSLPSTLEENRFDFKYSLKSLPYGSVTVIISDIKPTDFANYTLYINNNIGNQLKYTFILQIEDSSIKLGPGRDEMIPAIIGVVGFLVIALVILGIVKAKCYIDKKGDKYTDNTESEENVIRNDDLYFMKLKDNSGMLVNYKSYSDVITTITSASAMPKNLKRKPKTNAKPIYFNTVEDSSDDFIIQGQDKMLLLDQSLPRKVTEGFTNTIFPETEVYANT